MDAINMLKRHHRSTESALKKLRHSYDAKILDQLANELSAHMVIEETIFYPAVNAVDPQLVLESYEEHAMAQFALKRLLSTDASDPRFEPRATALLELIQHHVKEEEGDLFPKVVKKLDGDLMRTLGERMAKRFDELVARGHDAVLPRQPARITGDRSSERVASANGHAHTTH